MGRKAERQRLIRGTVRLPDCSGTVVSPRGLVLTAARCVQGHLGSEHQDGVVLAPRPEQKQKLSDVYVDRLVEVDDVSARIDSLRRTVTPDGEQRTALQTAIRQVERRYRKKTDENSRVEVISEAGGNRYVAYVYRRYNDVRLVFHPHSEVTSIGRVQEILSYPQFRWDVALLRVYNDGVPLETPSHLNVQSEGTRPGDKVYALGYPASTRRIETHAQHTFRRDVTLPDRRTTIERWRVHLRTYADTTASTVPSSWKEKMQEADREQKRIEARLDALRNDYFMGRLRDRDRRLHQRAAEDSTVDEEVHEILDRLAALQEQKRTYADAYRAFSFVRRSDDYRSATLARALMWHRKNLEGSDKAQPALQTGMEQPLVVDASLLKEHLQSVVEHVGADRTSDRVRQGIDNPARLIRQSVFLDPDSVRALVEAEREVEGDPMLAVAASIVDQYTSFAETWNDLQAQEQALLDTLAQYRYQLADRPVALPHARAPRLADGRITGYPYNGTIAPPVTTFYGMMGHFASVNSPGKTSLPSRWQSPAPAFDRSTPLMTVANTDLMGEYGGPILNTSLQVVGFQVDDNVQAAAGTYQFVPSRMRTVAVDVRGLLAGLAHVYNADALVRELSGDDVTVK